MFSCSENALSSSLHLQYQHVCQRERTAAARNTALVEDLAKLKLKMAALSSTETDRLAMLRRQYESYVEVTCSDRKSLHLQLPHSSGSTPMPISKSPGGGAHEDPEQTHRVIVLQSPSRQPDPLNFPVNSPSEPQALNLSSEPHPLPNLSSEPHPLNIVSSEPVPHNRPAPNELPSPQSPPMEPRSPPMEPPSPQSPPTLLFLCTKRFKLLALVQELMSLAGLRQSVFKTF